MAPKFAEKRGQSTDKMPRSVHPTKGTVVMAGGRTRRMWCYSYFHVATLQSKCRTRSETETQHPSAFHSFQKNNQNERRPRGLVLSRQTGLARKAPVRGTRKIHCSETVASALVFLVRYIDATFRAEKKITTARDANPSSCFCQILHSGYIPTIQSSR